MLADANSEWTGSSTKMYLLGEVHIKSSRDYFFNATPCMLRTVRSLLLQLTYLDLGTLVLQVCELPAGVQTFQSPVLFLVKELLLTD